MSNKQNQPDETYYKVGAVQLGFLTGRVNDVMGDIDIASQFATEGQKNLMSLWVSKMRVVSDSLRMLEKIPEELATNKSNRKRR